MSVYHLWGVSIWWLSLPDLILTAWCLSVCTMSERDAWDLHSILNWQPVTLSTSWKNCELNVCHRRSPSHPVDNVRLACNPICSCLSCLNYPSLPFFFFFFFFLFVCEWFANVHSNGMFHAWVENTINGWAKILSVINLIPHCSSIVIYTYMYIYIITLQVLVDGERRWGIICCCCCFIFLYE